MGDEKLRILIVEDHPEVGEFLRLLVEGQPDLSVIGLAMTGHEAIRRAAELRPDVILMDIHLPDIDGIQATWLISSKQPDTSIIMVTSEERTEYMQRAMVAGAQGYLLKPFKDGEEIAGTIRTVHQRAVERRALFTHPGTTVRTSLPPPRVGQRVALFSPKGGQGKTTVAVNLAIVLRALTDKQVVLVDADLRFGDANILLDLPTERSIVDLLPHIDQLDSDLLAQVLVTHSSGVQLLARPERPDHAEMIDAGHLGKLLAVLPRLFDYVVLDCEVSYDEKLLAVLDHVDQIFLVLTPNLGALRNATQFLEVADMVGYPRSKIDFVVNRANSAVGLSLGDIERALGSAQYFRLDSYGRLLTTSVNVGTPTVLSHKRSDFTHVMRQIGEYVCRRASAAS
jgi:pilus assembly protein CpaE